LMFIVAWCAWTFLPMRQFFCHWTLCRDGTLCGAKLCRCKKKTNKVAPADGSVVVVNTGAVAAVDAANQPAFPESQDARKAKEIMDGPGSWSYILPAPEYYDRLKSPQPQLVAASPAAQAPLQPAQMPTQMGGAQVLVVNQPPAQQLIQPPPPTVVVTQPPPPAQPMVPPGVAPMPPSVMPPVQAPPMPPTMPPPQM